MSSLSPHPMRVLYPAHMGQRLPRGIGGGFWLCRRGNLCRTEVTVEGEVTAVGNDGDPYVRIDGEKVYYKDEFFFIPADFDVGDMVTLLMNEDDVAMEQLKTAIDEEHFRQGC